MLSILMMTNCANTKMLNIAVYETSESGNALTKIIDFSDNLKPISITINSEEKFQTITGFGGSFTQASASLLNRLSNENRQKIIDAYFSEQGAKYSLTRAPMASCDFSLSNYTYANVPNDVNLDNFSVDIDKNDIIPMILEAKKISKAGFKIIASPWTAPPWMKDNNAYVGGKLLPQFNDAFALY